MPVGARFEEVEGTGDTFLERRPPSERSKPPRPWPTFLEFPRSFFFPKASDLGTTSLARHKTVLVTGGFFQVPLANWISGLPTVAVQTWKAPTNLAGFPVISHSGSVTAVPFPPCWGVNLGVSMTSTLPTQYLSNEGQSSRNHCNPGLLGFEG